ncbi:MAG: ribonuclease III [Pseudomonadota bacterium]
MMEIAGYAFLQPELLHEAMTHPGARKAYNNQRLEFLGDRMVNLAIADLLLRHFPHEREGRLSQRLSRLVDRATLARIALELGLDRRLEFGGGAFDATGRHSALADALEALIGAIYLDRGYEAAYAFIVRNWDEVLMSGRTTQPERDAKSYLQEYSLTRGWPLPDYQTIKREGPDHAPCFFVMVTVAGHDPIQGTGSSKQAAEMDAARRWLASFGKTNHGETIFDQDSAKTRQAGAIR